MDEIKEPRIIREFFIKAVEYDDGTVICDYEDILLMVFDILHKIDPENRFSKPITRH